MLRRIEKIPRSYRILIILFLNVLIVYGFFTSVIKARIETEKNLFLELQNLERTLDNLNNISKNIERFRKEYAELRVAFEEAMKELPEVKDIPNLLRSVTNLCAESKIKVKYFEPKSSQQKEFYAEFPFEIKFSGPYHNIGYFFDGIRRQKRIIHVVDFVLEAKGASSQPQSLEGSCTAKTYVYSPKEQKEVKKVEAPKK